jgi:hypothetical protein
MDQSELAAYIDSPPEEWIEDLENECDSQATREISNAIFNEPTEPAHTPNPANPNPVNINYFNNFSYKDLSYEPTSNSFSQNGHSLEWKKQKAKYTAKPDTNYEYEYVTPRDESGVRRKIYKRAFKRRFDMNDINNAPTISPEAAVITPRSVTPVDQPPAPPPPPPPPPTKVQHLEPTVIPTNNDERDATYVAASKADIVPRAYGERTVHQKLDVIISMLNILGKIIVLLK